MSRKERDCPNKTILASMDYNSCAVLGLALFLEKWSKGATKIDASLQWLFVEGVTDKRSELAVFPRGRTTIQASLRNMFSKVMLLSHL